MFGSDKNNVNLCTYYIPNNVLQIVLYKTSTVKTIQTFDFTLNQ